MRNSVTAGIRPLVMRLGRRIVTHSGRWTVAPATDRQSLVELLQRLHPVEPAQGLRRLGPSGDGGYLVPDDLEGIAACFSPGVGELSGFELDCVELGMRAHLADASVDSPAGDRAPERTDPANLDFIQSYIRAMPDDESITLEQWVNSLEGDEEGDLLLQIDIEGDEWGVFLGAPNAILERFRIIVVELHQLHRLFDAYSFPLLRLALEKILENHICVHIHPNNSSRTMSIAGVELPWAAEFTFLRRDRIDLARAPFASRFPHPLDEHCVETYDPLVLSESLYRSR